MPVWSPEEIGTETFSTPLTKALMLVPSQVIAKWAH